jgi:hypothetical protein
MKLEEKMNDNYFLDLGLNKIGLNIYVYKNFLSIDEIESLTVLFDEVKQNSLFDPGLVGTPFENKVSVPLKEMEPVLDRAKSLFGSTFSLHPNTSVNVMREGDEWGQHSDNHDFIEKRNLSLLLKDGEPYEVVQDTKYGIVVYFNEVEEGGELYYSNQDITYSPSPGDLIVHSAEEDCMHGVNTIIRGHRYSYSNFLSTDLKIPSN